MCGGGVGVCVCVGGWSGRVPDGLQIVVEGDTVVLG